MLNQIGQRFHAVIVGAKRVFFYPVIAVLDKGRRFGQSHDAEIKKLTTGTMIGSGAVLPSLNPATLGVRVWYQFATALYVSSTIGFSWLNRMEITRNGPYTLAGVSTVAIIAVLSSRFSPEEFTPYVPFSVAMGLLVTVYVVPWIRASFRPENRITLQDEILERNQNQSVRSDVATEDPDLTRSNGGFLGNAEPLARWYSSPEDFLHMNAGREYPMVTIPDSLEIGSNGDLESGRGDEDSSSTATAKSRDPLI